MSLHIDFFANFAYPRIRIVYDTHIRIRETLMVAGFFLSVFLS